MPERYPDHKIATGENKQRFFASLDSMGDRVVFQFLLDSLEIGFLIYEPVNHIKDPAFERQIDLLEEYIETKRAYLLDNPLNCAKLKPYKKNTITSQLLSRILPKFNVIQTIQRQKFCY